MIEFSNPLTSGGDGSQGSVILTAIVLLGLLFVGLKLKSFASRGARASQARSTELASRLATVDVKALLDQPDATAPRMTAPNTDDFFSNSARKAELSQTAAAPAEAPAASRRVTSDAQAYSATNDDDALFEVPTLADLPRRSPNEPSVSPEAARRVMSRLKDVEARKQADPAYKPSRAEQVARYAVTAQRRDGGSAVYLKREPNVAEIRRYKKAAEILGANDLAYILEHSADLVDAAQNASDEAEWNEYLQSANELSELFRVANETDQSAGRLVTLADAYLAKNA